MVESKADGSNMAEGTDTVGSNNTEDQGDDETFKPPDGGYGWVIVMAAFVCNLITDGTAFSFGVLLDDLLDYFGDTKSKTSWIGSIFMGVPLLASPIASALINKYGCRAVSIAGGLLSTAGFVLSYFADSILFLCFSFGFVSGVGLAMVYTPAVVIVAFYFEKRRALATGLSVAGSGIGTLAFAPFVEFLTETYGWRGAILILAGVMLNICVFGALFRPLPEPEQTNHSICETPAETDAVKNSTSCSSHIAKMRKLYSEPASHSLIQLPTYLATNNSSRCHDSECRHDDVALVTASNDDLRLNGRNGKSNNSRRRADSKLTVPNGHHVNQHDDTARYHDNHSNHVGSHDFAVKPRSQTASSDGRTSFLDRLHPMYKPDIFYRGSLLWIAQPNRDPTRVTSCPDLYTRTRTELHDTESQSGWCQCEPVKRVVKEMLDVSIFYRPLYVLFFISNFLLYMWYDIPYFYVPNSASQSGLSDDEASWIISVIGIGNTIGQVAFGVIADVPFMNNSFVYGFGIFVCGISVCFIPLCEDMISLSTVGCLFGTFIGANYALCSILIVDLLSLDMLTNAYGIVLCGQGVANLVGPPLGGLLSDYTNSYLATYLSSGAFIALSGLIMIGVSMYQCRKPSQKEPEPEPELLEIRQSLKSAPV